MQELKNRSELAEAEYQILKSLQASVATIVLDYMEANHVGFNELVRRLRTSPSQVSKILKGEGNLTFDSLAKLFALMDMHPVIHMMK